MGFVLGFSLVFCVPGQRPGVYRNSLMRSPVMTSWHPASWHTKTAQQQPRYEHPAQLEKVVAQLSRLPPIVVSWEVDAARERLAAAQRGDAFLLAGR